MPAERTYVPLMSPSPPLMTADELLLTHVPDKRTELVRGVLVVREPAGSRHGLVTMNLGAELAVYAKQTGAGGVYAAESGFKLASKIIDNTLSFLINLVLKNSQSFSNTQGNHILIIWAFPADIMAVDADNITPLMLAAQNAKVDVVELFSFRDGLVAEIRVFQQDTHLLLATLDPA